MELHHIFIGLAWFAVGQFSGIAIIGFFCGRKLEPKLPGIHCACSWCRRGMDADGHAVRTSHGICTSCLERDALGSAQFQLPKQEDHNGIVPKAPSPDPTGSDGADFKRQ